jgi:hypothetical protein
MKTKSLALLAALALSVAVGGCTVLKGEYSSTTTEYKEESGVEARVEGLESRMDRMERALERIEGRLDSGS